MEKNLLDYLQRVHYDHFIIDCSICSDISLDNFVWF